jgi:ATP-dependent DNA ligase
MLPVRPRLCGFVPPCLPTKASQPPSGDTWVHEIKHDGFRVIARKDGERVRLFDEGEAGRASKNQPERN